MFNLDVPLLLFIFFILSIMLNNPTALPNLKAQCLKQFEYKHTNNGWFKNTFI